MKRVIFILLVIGCGSAGAHGLRHTVTEGKSVVIKLSYRNGAAFAGEAYEIYRAGDSDPYQSGRTDPFGRIVFIPDSSGTWRIKAFSEDGHGLDISINANPSSENPDTGKAPADTLELRPPTGKAPVDTLELHPATDKAPVGSGWRIIMAFSLLFGVFGVVSIFMRKKK